MCAKSHLEHVPLGHVKNFSIRSFSRRIEKMKKNYKRCNWLNLVTNSDKVDDICDTDSPSYPIR